MSATTVTGRPAAAEPVVPARRRPGGGWRIVAAKELADGLTSVRFVVLIGVVTLAALLSVEQSADDLRSLSNAGVSEIPSVFLGLFYVSSERVLSFSFTLYELVGLLGPLFGIAFGFDAVNVARGDGTLARLVSQPIHRDDVINGRFAAGLGLITIALTTMTALVCGLGILRLGIHPGAEDLARLVVFLAVSICWVAVWLAFAILCSVLFRQAAASALVSIAAWVLFAIFASSIAGILADRFSPVEDGTPAEVVENQQTEQTIERISPKTLYVEASRAVLSPLVVSLDVVAPEDLEGILPDTQLDLEQSLLLAWPQLVGLVAITVILFGVTYIVFMRQEIRA
jgi:ABC-2 type transport system permease protein